METQVLIAGAGPTGMTLALELASQGMSCRILDGADGPAPTSRALAVHPRTLELLDRHGVAAEIERRGTIQTGIRFATNRRLLARIPHGSFDYQSTCLPQAETEAILREAVLRAGVTIEWGRAVTGFEQDQGGVSVHTGRGPLRAEWIVGCDGAHSVVRKAMGVAFEGEQMAELNLMADVRPDWDLDGGDVRIWFHPDGALVALLQPHGTWRLIATVRDQDLVPSEEFFQEVLARRAGLRPRKLGVQWMSQFRVHSRLAASYRVARALLAGDSAHVHSPAGGQGMNLGIQDAVNLGWKLAEVIRGGRTELLDTYEAERRPVAAHAIRATASMTRMAVAARPVQQLLRDNLMPRLLSLPPVRRKMALQASGIGLGYPKSPLSSVGAGDRAPFVRGFYAGAWELFTDVDGRGALVRPDGYVGARFERPEASAARAYFVSHLGLETHFIDAGRQLPRAGVMGMGTQTATMRVA